VLLKGSLWCEAISRDRGPRVTFPVAKTTAVSIAALQHMYSVAGKNKQTGRIFLFFELKNTVATRMIVK